jgi:hypothetical protein
LPRLSHLEPAEAAEIRKVALGGEGGAARTDIEPAGVPRSLITAGVFAMEPVGAAMAVRFSSPAMRTHALRQRFSARPRLPMHADALLSGASFAREVVRRMRQGDLPGSVSTAARGSLLERRYLMSFYA